MGTRSSIFADESGDESARSSDGEPPSIFRDRDDGDAAAVDPSTTEGEDDDATMTVFVDGERREFVLEES